MALSRIDLVWPRATEAYRFSRGSQEIKCAVIMGLLDARFGAIDSQLETIIPALLELPIEKSTHPLLQFSREELIQCFSNWSSRSPESN